MSSKLFVGGLSPTTDDASLRAAFETHGYLVDARVILDRDTGRNRGFGFVSFRSPEEARTALEQMRGAMVDGRAIRVDLAEERRPGGGPRPDGGPTTVTRGHAAGLPRDRGPRFDGDGSPARGPRLAVDRTAPRAEARPSFPRRPSGPPPRSGAPWIPPAPDPEEAGWDDARMPRKTEPRKPRERPEREAAPKAPKATARTKRVSGQTWRHWTVEAGDDDDY